ncbi:Fic family protein [Candidatus Woesearchaeota archaeon]|nr:Fic family protein [Candidatus Woesearchaeota archaeon]
MLSRKDLVTLNLEFHTGKLANPGSLEFALDQAQRSRDWLKSTAYLVRAIVSDHVFEDGNKRTAAAIIATSIDLRNLSYNKEKIDRTVLKISAKSIKDTRKLSRLIKNVIE